MQSQLKAFNQSNYLNQLAVKLVMRKSQSESKNIKYPLNPEHFKFTKSQHNYQSIIDFSLPTHAENIEKKLGHHLFFQIIARDALNSFLKMKIITNKQDYKFQEHLSKSKEKLEEKMDKLSLWLKDNITERVQLKSAEKNLEQKIERINQREQKIAKQIGVIAEKLQNKKIAEMKRKYKEEIVQKLIQVPINQQYEISQAKAEKLLQQSKQHHERVAQRYKQMTSQFEVWGKHQK